MVNATEMAKPFGKLVGDWLSNKSTKEFTSALSSDMGIPISALIQVVKGGNAAQGTWIHEDVALEFARWLSPKFAIWCNARIKELLTQGTTSIANLSRKELAMMVVQAEEEKERLAAANEQKDKAIAKLQPLADFATAAFSSDTLISISQAAKILKLGFGRNTLFKKLRERGVFFTNRNEPKQKYVDAKYFNLVEGKPIPRSDGSILIPVTAYCTQKGLAYINHLFGGKRTTPQLAKIGDAKALPQSTGTTAVAPASTTINNTTSQPASHD